MSQNSIFNTVNDISSQIRRILVRASCTRLLPESRSGAAAVNVDTC
jgi:hypothetical protein